MLQAIYSVVNKIYEHFAYHITYELDDDENVVIIEKNIHFKSRKITATIVAIIAGFVLISSIGLLSEAIITANDNKVLINRYYAREICIENSTWTECFDTRDVIRFRLYIDDDPFPTLYIKED